MEPIKSKQSQRVPEDTDTIFSETVFKNAVWFYRVE